MFRKVMRSKIHRATVTMCDVDYVGSVTIDADLLRAADIRPNESVHVFDVDNGARLETYVIRGEPGSGTVVINGAAARLVDTGHKVLIVSFGYLTQDQLDSHQSTVVVVDDRNRIDKVLRYSSLIDEPALAP